MEKMETRIDNYWSLRAEEFSRFRLLDLASPMRTAWTKFFRQELPQRGDRPIRALDCGTGAGFFAFMLAELGCETTGIDYSHDMVQQAEQNAKLLHYPPVTFLQMDAQEMTFSDESFDFIVSRNMTWTVPAPEKVYQQWFRLLAPGGVVINFDANYGHMFRRQDDSGVTERNNAAWEKSDFKTIGTRPDMIRERNDITRELSITQQVRPQWDVDLMLQLGFDRVSVDMRVAGDITAGFNGGAFEMPKKEAGEPDHRIFCVKGVKL